MNGTARVHVFSGTGNSRHLARVLAGRLEAAGLATETVEVTSAGIEALRSRKSAGRPVRNQGDLDLFLFPVYAMSVPRIMERYMKALGQPEGAGSAAIVSTNGRIGTRFRDGHEGQALAQAERILKRRGWRTVYRETLDYPQNITNFVPIQGEDRKAAIMALAEPRIGEVGRELLAWMAEGGAATGGEARAAVHKRRCGPLFHLVGWPFGWLYRLVGRRAFAMLFAADGRCDGCGACAASCPAKAISMVRGRPAWSYRCEGCERCINLCPKAAIQTSAVRVALMVFLCIFAGACPLEPVFLTAAAGAGLPSWLAGSAWYILGIVLAFALFRAIDLILVAFALVPGMRPVLAFGWTRWFRRYKAPALKPREVAAGEETR